MDPVTNPFALGAGTRSPAPEDLAVADGASILIVARPHPAHGAARPEPGRPRGTGPPWGGAPERGDALAVFGGEIHLVQRYAEILADLSGILEILCRGAIGVFFVVLPVVHEQTFNRIPLLLEAQGGNGGVYKAVASGEKLYGFVVDYLPVRGKAKGAPVAFVAPKEGLTAVTEPVAILKTAKNVPAAKTFVSFLLSAKGQKLAADMGYIPADPAVAEPAGFPPRDKIKLMAFDPAKALKDNAANLKKFADIFGG